MRKVNSDEELLLELVDLKDKVVLDIGCGIGHIVRWMTEIGAEVIGVDNLEMINKAKEFVKVKDEKYLEGGGENIPTSNSKTDIIIFIASFHHIPISEIENAFKECERVLKPGGMIVIIEPVAEKGSYSEIIKLVEDETGIQEKAYEVIKNSNFEQIDQQFFYLERSLNDYIQLLNIFVENKIERDNFIKKAEEITIHLAKQSNVNIEDFKYKSISRLNILKKDD